MTAKHRVLCIEDDSRLRRLLEEDLTEAGYDVALASNALAGIELFFAHAPALVLCDIRMQVISGFDFFERLQRLDARCFGAAFIFLTALADRESELRGRRLGADDYILKPVDYEILHEVIRLRIGGRPPGTRPPKLSLQLSAQLTDWFQGPSLDPPPRLTQGLRDHIAGPKGVTSQAAPLGNGTYDIILDDMSIGILIIDQEGRYQYVNETAARVLGKPRVALIGARAVAPLATFARVHAERAAKQHSIVSAKQLAIGPDGTNVTAIGRHADGARVAVILPVLLAARPLFSELLATLFDLTQAERSLATELTSGANLHEVADRRGVTIATVRTQLRSVYSKLGVSKQSDLARTLTVLHAANGAASV